MYPYPSQPIPSQQTIKPSLEPEAIQLKPELKWLFVGVDLAPLASLESGIAVIDRDKKLIRADKLFKRQAIIDYILALGPAQQTIVVLDVPKSLEIDSRYRQERLRRHPGSVTEGPDDERFASRVFKIYDTLTEAGITVLLSFSWMAKLNYKLILPYRGRSSQGCQAMQFHITHRLGILGFSKNAFPASVLDATVDAYTAWLVCQGQTGLHYRIFQRFNSETEHIRFCVEPLKRLSLTKRRARRLVQYKHAFQSRRYPGARSRSSSSRSTSSRPSSKKR